MVLKPRSNVDSLKSSNKTNKDVYIAVQLALVIVFLAILSKFFVIVNAGERGVLMQFGKVQEQVLGEGLHVIVPTVYTVKKLSVRV